MLKNITLSAEEELIHRARQKAQNERTTLNANFRCWLKQFHMRQRQKRRSGFYNVHC
jgi:hypothetical protein